MIVGINTENIRPAFDLESQVLVQQLDRTDADSEQHKALEKFKGCNQAETRRGGAGAGSWLFLLVPRGSHRVISDYIVLLPFKQPCSDAAAERALRTNLPSVDIP